jgi:hypothetical protein
MNEADVLVFTGDDARDDFAPGDFGIDDGFASPSAIIDHHDKILHAACSAISSRRVDVAAAISENQK